MTAVACGLDGTFSPSAPRDVPEPFMSGPAAGLQFSASMSKPVIRIGDTATIAFELRNVTSQSAILRFSSTCQILPYIRDSEAIPHPGGGWGCRAAITSLTLGPGEGHILHVIVHGGVTGGTTPRFVELNPSEYHAYAELGDGLGRSPSVSFRVRAD
jgi:hypothetical protein